MLTQGREVPGKTVRGVLTNPELPRAKYVITRAISRALVIYQFVTVCVYHGHVSIIVWRGIFERSYGRHAIFYVFFFIYCLVGILHNESFVEFLWLIMLIFLVAKLPCDVCKSKKNYLKVEFIQCRASVVKSCTRCC